jgi:integrase
MATTRFTLRRTDSDTPQPIYLIFRYRNKRLVHSTGAKVLPKFWNTEKRRVKNTSNVPDRDNINALLSDLEAETSRFYSEMLAKQAFTIDGLKNHLNTFQGNTPQKEVKTLFDFFRKFIEDSPKRTQTDKGKLIHPNTVAKYQSTLNLIKEFSNKWSRKLDFNSVDLEFYKDFTEYLQNRKHRKGAGYSLNAIGKHIQIIKTVLNEATAQGINTNDAYRSKKFKVLKEDSENTYLNEAELNILEKYDFSKMPKLEKVRDLFIIGCWTGLRFSDLSTLNPENHIHGNIIEIEQYKTGGKVVIPIHPAVKAVLQKYNGQIPLVISNQKFNDYLKEVCKMAGINERVQKGITQGGLRVIQFCEKWEMVSSHTARRSFATNLYKSGFPAVSIMQITGHKKETVFLKYIKATAQDHAKMLSLHWEKKNTPVNENILKIVG